MHEMQQEEEDVNDEPINEEDETYIEERVAQLNSKK
jgi:hypothetical protein